MASAEGTGATVHLGRERQLAGGHWLLSGASDIARSREEWNTKGATWLLPGVLFGAVVIRASLVHAALGQDDPAACRRPLAEHLDGPVFYTPPAPRGEGSYTALVTASTAMSWRTRGGVGHHYRALLLVPSPQATFPQEDGPWWVVPLDGPGVLCRWRPLVSLIGAGRQAGGSRA